jgi:hypothetical protein
MSKMIGIGTVLKCSTAGTTTFGQTIGQIRGISRSGLSVSPIETHTLDDAPNMTFAPGWVDGGELEIRVAYDPGTTSLAHVVLNSMFLNRVTGKWKFIAPTTTITEEFDGFITGVERPVEMDGLIEQTFTAKVTGAPGLTT